MPRGTYGLEAINAKIAELNKQLEEAKARIADIEEKKNSIVTVTPTRLK